MDILIAKGDELTCWTGSCRAKDAVAALIKRLAHRNANVQLYTLEVKRSGQPTLCSTEFRKLTCGIGIIACQCAVAELWTEDSSRIGL
jgi:hypothetical protein